MYPFFVGLLILSILILLIEMLYITSRISSRAHAFTMLFTLATLINNLGYLLEVTAGSKETAIMGTRICYLGKAYLPFLFFVYTMYICKVKLPRLLTGILLSFHTLILFLVFFSNKITLYYSSIDYIDNATFSHLVLGHGVFYYLYMTSVGFYFIIMMVTISRHIKTLKSKTELKQLRFLQAIIIVNAVALLLFLLNLTYGYDSTATSYFISSLILFFALFRYNLFDVLMVAKDYAIDNLDSGLVVLDENERLLYFNEAASTICPGLQPGCSERVLNAINSFYKNKRNIFHDNKVYSVMCDDVIHENELRGKMYILQDVTDSYNYTERLKHDVETKTHEIEKIQHSIIASFANMVEARDGATGLHIRNTSLYVAIVAKALQEQHTYDDILSDDYVNTLIEAAPLHDIGKIAISDTILLKPGKLTDEEFNIMKSHSAIGARMIEDALSEVENNNYLQMAKEMAHYHHERWDGTGYPNNLKGDEIPLCARIMAIADVYDALRSKRCYKEGFSKEKSLEIIKESSGTHFDPAIVDVFVDNIVAIEQV